MGWLVIRWKRSRDHHVYSHCGRWTITPEYAGCTRPQNYVLWHDGVRVSGMHATQYDAKDAAAWMQAEINAKAEKAGA